MDKIIVLNGYLEEDKDNFMKKVEDIEEVLINTKLENLTNEISLILSKYMDYSEVKGVDYANKYLKDNFDIDNFEYFDDILEQKYSNIECYIDAVYIPERDCIAFTFNNDDKSLNQIFNTKFEKYEYWNNIIKPEDVEDEDWENRKLIWTKFLESKKIKIDLFDKEILKKVDEKVVFEKIKENYDNRLLEIAKELVTEEYIDNNPDLLVNNKTGYFKSNIFNCDIESKFNKIKSFIKK